MSSTEIARPQASTSAIPASWAARLVERMQALYGAKFAQQWAGIEPVRLTEIWAEELAGMTGEELARGLASCRSRPWPPTLPEFVLLCRPSMDPVTAHTEAVLGMQERKRGNLGEWSHPAVYWAAVKIGAHDLLNQGYAAIRGRWERELRDSFALGQWDAVPAPAVALPAPGQDVTSNAEGQKRIRELSAQALSTGADHKRWARKILENPKGRSSFAIAAARSALEVTA